MASADFFRCEKYAVTMLKRRCVERQTNQISLYESCQECGQGKEIREQVSRGKGQGNHVGSSHSPHVGSSLRLEPTPREAGEAQRKGGITMAKPEGQCSNCLRVNMKISSKSGNGLCGSCQAAIRGMVAGSPEREAKLREAAARFAGQPKLSRGKQARKVEGTRPQVGSSLRFKPTLVNQPGNPQIGGTGVPPVIPEAEKTFHRGIFVDFAMPEDAELISRIEEFAKRERRTVSAQILYFLDKEMKFQEQECR